MASKITCLILISLFLFSVFSISTNAQEVWTGEAIVIREDGTVYPSDVPIVQNGMTYTLTGDIKCGLFGLIIRLDNIIIDGAGHSIEGPGEENYHRVDYGGIIVDAERAGIYISITQNIRIENVRITQFYNGIYVISSSNNIITSNQITQCSYCVRMEQASQNNLILNNNFLNARFNAVNVNECSYNNITANDFQGRSSHLAMYNGNNNKISGNKISNTGGYAIGLIACEKNILFNNTIVGCNEGFYLQNVQNTEIINNTIQNCGTAMRDYTGYNAGEFIGNRIYYNNFIDNNDFDLEKREGVGQWDDGVSQGNYYSDYVGIDANNDGIGDSPYIITNENVDNYPLMEQYAGAVIPEFPSWLILPLFLTATLIVALARKRLLRN